MLTVAALPGVEVEAGDIIGRRHAVAGRPRVEDRPGWEEGGP